MAFIKSNWELVAKGFGCSAPCTYAYFSTTDSLAVISASGYFDALKNAVSNEVKIGDRINIKSSDADATLIVSAVTPNITSDSANNGSFTLNLTGGFTGTQPRLVRFQRTGNVVTLMVDNFQVTQTGAGVVTSGIDVPLFLRTSMEQEMTSLVAIDNGIRQAIESCIDVNGSITWRKADGANFSGTATLALQEGSITYLI